MSWIDRETLWIIRRLPALWQTDCECTNAPDKLLRLRMYKACRVGRMIHLSQKISVRALEQGTYPNFDRDAAPFYLSHAQFRELAEFA
jgi:hypothetical protein